MNLFTKHIPSKSTEGVHAIFATLAIPSYGVFAVGNAFSLIGTWMQRIGVGWLAWQLTGSGAWIGLLAFCDLFPSVVLGFLGGAAADRLNRMHLMRISNICALVQATLLAVFAYLNFLTIEMLLFMVFIQGVIAGFNQPVRLALISSLVPRSHLSTAVAINSVIFNLARFLGPAVAGITILHMSIGLVFAINALSYIAMIASLIYIEKRIALPAPQISVEATHVSWPVHMWEGLKYVAHHPGIGPLLSLYVLTAICVRPFVELLPALAAGVFARGAEGLATLSSAIGIGAMVGGVWLAQRGDPRGLTILTLIAGTIMALATLGLTLINNFYIAVGLTTIAGAFLVMSGAGTQTIVQMAVDDSMRGRVMSMFGIIFRGGSALGALIIGVISEGTGLRIPLAIGAVLAIFANCWVICRRHAMINALENLNQR